MKIIANKLNHVKFKFSDVTQETFFVYANALYLKITGDGDTIAFLPECGPVYAPPGDFDPTALVVVVPKHDVSITFDLPGGAKWEPR